MKYKRGKRLSVSTWQKTAGQDLWLRVQLKWLQLKNTDCKSRSMANLHQGEKHK
jgi:hypothetical protein